jgi:hypothetical protein
MKRQRCKSLVEKKRLKDLEILDNKLSVEYWRHVISLIRVEARMNREAARLAKTRSRRRRARLECL